MEDKKKFRIFCELQKSPDQRHCYYNLRTGDVLFFQHPNSTSLATVAITTAGVVAGFFTPGLKGNPNSIHCVIVVEGQEDGRGNGNVMLAHVRKGGHIMESMHDMFDRKGERLPFSFLRPNSESFANTIAKIASSKEAQTINDYSKIGVISRFIMPTNGSGEKPPKEKPFNESVCCSEFIAQTIKKAATREANIPYPSFRSKLQPRTLEAQLEESPLFSKYTCNAEGNCFQRKIDEQLTNITRVGKINRSLSI